MRFTWRTWNVKQRSAKIKAPMPPSNIPKVQNFTFIFIKGPNPDTSFNSVSQHNYNSFLVYHRNHINTIKQEKQMMEALIGFIEALMVSPENPGPIISSINYRIQISFSMQILIFSTWAS